VAIKEGKLLYVGTEQGINDSLGPDTDKSRNRECSIHDIQLMGE